MAVPLSVFTFTIYITMVTCNDLTLSGAKVVILNDGMNSPYPVKFYDGVQRTVDVSTIGRGLLDLDTCFRECANANGGPLVTSNPSCNAVDFMPDVLAGATENCFTHYDAECNIQSSDFFTPPAGTTSIHYKVVHLCDEIRVIRYPGEVSIDLDNLPSGMAVTEMPAQANEVDCGLLCNVRPQCVAADFSAANSVCRHFESSSSNFVDCIRTIPTGGSTAYMFPCLDPGPFRYIKKGLLPNAATLPATTDDFFECSALCAADADCMGYQYNTVEEYFGRINPKCALYDANSVSKIVACETPDDESNMYIVLKDSCQSVLEELIHTVQPVMGPLSGGTKVTVTGAGLDVLPSYTIRLSGVECPLLSMNSTTLICETGQAEDSKSDVPLSITIEELTLTQTFTYRPDPVVIKIEPTESILSGGTMVTVTGVGLDVVQEPRLLISVLRDNNPVHTLESICQIVSSTSLHCVVPRFDIFHPDGDLNLNALQGSTSVRRRRGIDRLNRHRRQAVGTVNSERISFFVGVSLDGVRMHRMFSNFTVYLDPEIYRWSDTMVVTRFVRQLEVKGANLLRGIQSTDYSVLIGQSVCGTLVVYDNLLTCKAPQDTPVPHKKNADTTGLLHVRVLFGLNKEGLAGKPRYSTAIFDDPLIRWGAIGAGALLVVVIIIVIIACALRHQKG